MTAWRSYPRDTSLRILLNATQQHGDRPFVEIDGRGLSYGQFVLEVHRLARGLIERRACGRHRRHHARQQRRGAGRLVRHQRRWRDPGAHQHSPSRRVPRPSARGLGSVL